MSRFPPIEPSEWRELAKMLLGCVAVTLVNWWLP
jgi:hypothetical protein